MEFNGRLLLIADTTKVAKEAKQMPAVKSLHQDSKNSGKPEYIMGHHFGFVAVLVGTVKKAFSIPLQGQLQEGIGDLNTSEGLDGKPPTLITRIARMIVEKARQTGRCCYVTLDAYYAVGPTFLIMKEALGEKGEQLVHVVTWAKDNTVGFLNVAESLKKYREEDKVTLMELFTRLDWFEEVRIETYGKVRTVHYMYIDLLWKPIRGLIRFVAVMDGNGRYILMSSDLTLDPIQIITIYSYRAKTEYMFLALKHLIGGFCYHFWTSSLSENPILRLSGATISHLGVAWMVQFRVTLVYCSLV